MNLQLNLDSPTATTRLAQAVADRLDCGDVVLLKGPVGAGKTHFARALIRQLCGADLDVPSPSFTLVQTYQTPRCPVWHVDLYRLTNVSQVLELGLDEAFETGITVIEWPEMLGRTRPERFLEITLFPDATDENRRTARIAFSGSWAWLADMATVFDD